MGNQKIKVTPVWLPLIRERLSAIADLTPDKQIARRFSYISDAPVWWVGCDMTTLVTDTVESSDRLPDVAIPTQTGLVFFAKPVCMMEDKLTTLQRGLERTDPVGVIGLYWYPVVGEKVAVFPLVDTPNRQLRTPVQFTFLGADRLHMLDRILDVVFLLAKEPHITQVHDFRPTPLDRVAHRYESQVRQVKTILVRENMESPYTQHTADSPKRSYREYSHRFIVRGFWRNQVYGPNRGLRKRIWVPPYIKGPADKPLITKTGILTLRR